MCYFITVGVPEDRSNCLEEAIPRGLEASPCSNTCITRYLPQNYRLYVLTSGMCSCDLFHVSSPSRPQQSHTESERRKYQKKGWSDTKIERALAQAARAQASAQRADFVGLRPDVRELLAHVAEDTGELAIVAHWYTGDVEMEKFVLQEGPLVSPEGLHTGDIAFGEDQVLSIHRKG